MTYVGKKPADIIATAVDTTTGTFSGDLTVDTNTLFVDSSNNRVGIGISSPDGRLHVHTASAGSVTANSDADDLVVENNGHAGINILSPDANRSAIQFGHTSDNLQLQIRHDGGTSLSQIISDDPIALWTNGSERARIDSSGNLLVGTTSTDDSTDGFKLKSNGQKLTVTRDGAESLVLNRRTSDGDILKFRKDNTAVGSIGAWSSGLLVGTGDVGLAFVDGTPERIQPRKADDQTSADGLIDLGHSSNRFKDLYLSGGVYLGGTGSANHLDDYEEGTWTPTFSNLTVGNGTLAGVYTKTGNTVTAKMSLIFGSTTSISGNVSVGSLPFANGATNNSAHQAVALDSGSYWINLVARFISSSTTVDIMYPSQVPYNTLLTITATTPFTWTTSDRIEFTLAYSTS